MPRNSAIAALTCAVAALLPAGCGSSANPATGRAAATKTAGAAGGAGAAGASHGSVTKQQALAYAHIVNLTTADLPGSTIRRAEREKAVKPGAVSEQRCAGGVSPYRRVADVRSDTLRVRMAGWRGAVHSDVQVMPSAALAARDYAAVAGPRGRHCYEARLHRLAAASSGTGAGLSGASLSWVSDPLPGAKSFGGRLRLAVRAPGGRTVAAYVDALGFQTGPAEVTLTTVSVTHPPPPARETRLLAVLYDRARAHAL